MILRKDSKLVYSLCCFLLLLAPILATKQTSSVLWGEINIPESLRQ